ncbi:MAG: peptide chain release factor N(5)-glutamine methyltransferase [Deltaproteobacteria bacterium]|nr:peptide chain release factor N(5)-glutamine methyltransferase [Deltaproteobacteria bacterium]
MTIRDVLRDATGVLVAADVPSAQIDAEWLLAHTLNCRRIDLHTNGDTPLQPQSHATFAALLARRVAREPLQYLLGSGPFYGRLFHVTPDVLIPRPETEQLVDFALRGLPERPANILEIGTGSGCIAITLAIERPTATVTATDISVAALRVAKENATTFSVLDRLRLLEADGYPPHPTAPYTMIISNPPYGCEAEWDHLQPEVRDYEPRHAVIGGDDGLAVIRRIITEAPQHLISGGDVWLEIGMGQADAVIKLIATCGDYSTSQVHDDLQGIARILHAQRR